MSVNLGMRLRNANKNNRTNKNFADPAWVEDKRKETGYSLLTVGGKDYYDYGGYQVATDDAKVTGGFGRENFGETARNLGSITNSRYADAQAAAAMGMTTGGDSTVRRRGRASSMLAGYGQRGAGAGVGSGFVTRGAMLLGAA